MRQLVGPTVLTVFASLVGVPSCASAHGSRADRLCRSTLYRAVASSSSTTVGDVRLLSGGPAGAQIVADAFPGAPASAYAAWCWTRGNRSLTAYAVASGFPAHQVASYDGLLPHTPTPEGAPLIK